MKRSPLYLLTISLLASCGYPLRTPPLLNGELTGLFCAEGKGDEACVYVGAPPSKDALPATLNVRAESWSATEYTFSGTLEFDGTTYTVSGREEGVMNEQFQYLAPQAHLLGGFVTASLTDEAGTSYRLEGFSRYGLGGGLTPDRERPSANLSIFLPDGATCEADSHCVVGNLLFAKD